MGFVDLFSTREISIGIWTIVFVILILFLSVKNFKIREAVFHLFKTAFNKYIIIFTFITFTYVALSIISLSKLSIWNWIYLKDVILWFLFIGIPICFNAIIERDNQYFYELVKGNFKVAIFIEFLVGTFTFSIFIELLLVPISTLLFLLYSVSKLDESHKPAEKFFSFILNTLGFIILFSVGKNAVQSYEELNVLELLIAFSLPITMTIMFLPLSYFFALYSGYELLFIRLKFRLPNKENRKIVIRKIVRTCKLSLMKVEFFSENYLSKFYSTIDEEKVNEIVKVFISQYDKKTKSVKLGGEIFKLEDNKNLSAYSLILAFLLIDFISLFSEPFNSIGIFNVSLIIGYLLIFIAITGLATEVNNTLKENENNKSEGFSDFSVAIFLLGVIFLSWQSLNYLGWINNYTTSLLMFIALLSSYGLFRSILLIFKYIFLNSKGKLESIELLLRFIPIVISIIALFWK